MAFVEGVEMSAIIKMCHIKKENIKIEDSGQTKILYLEGTNLEFRMISHNTNKDHKAFDNIIQRFDMLEIKGMSIL